MHYPRIALDQWRALIAVVEAGGYAQAAEQLHKSQSSVTYAVQKIERQLGLKVFRIDGRKAVLTQAGEVLYRRARTLLEEAAMLERSAGAMADDWKPEIVFAADVLFPTWLLLECLNTFGKERPETRIEVYETAMSGADEMLRDGRADIAITGFVPEGFLGDALMPVRFIPVAHPDHPLHRLGRPLTYRDLRKHRQLVIRDSGSRRTRGGSWLIGEQRWTVTHKSTSIAAACKGFGFAWYPELNIRRELEQGLLKPLPMKEGAERFAQLYLVLGDRDYADRDTVRLAEIIRQAVSATCDPERHAAASRGG